MNKLKREKLFLYRKNGQTPRKTKHPIFFLQEGIQSNRQQIKKEVCQICYLSKTVHTYQLETFRFVLKTRYMTRIDASVTSIHSTLFFAVIFSKAD